jgi:rhamnosyltransferase
MIVAVITTYKPDANFIARFEPLLSVCQSIVVSDNTPGGHTGFKLPQGFTIIHNRHNIGIGPALNMGLNEARRQSAHQVILFDQDSTPTPEFVLGMLNRLKEAHTVYGQRCCIGPTHVDDQTGSLTGKVIGASARCSTRSSWESVSCLPTSGMVFDIDALRAEDCFAEDLFLDLVDFEWCWRLHRSEWQFLRAPDLKMFHRLGEAERRFLGLTFHVPAPYRHYFQVRDTLRLSHRAYVPTYSKLRLLAVLPLKALIYPFILDRGVERLRWMVRGAIDGVRGVQGVGAARTRLSS